MKLKKLNQNGLAHYILIVIVVVLALVSLIAWKRLNNNNKIPEIDTTPSATQVANVHEVHGLSEFKNGSEVLFKYPANWGNTQTIEDHSEDVPPIASFSFKDMGETNSVKVWKVDHAGVSVSGGKIICLYNAGKQTWKGDPSSIREYDKDDQAHVMKECDPYSQREFKNTKIVTFNYDDNRVDRFFAVGKVLIELSITTSKDDILRESTHSGCCALPPMYKVGVPERLKDSADAATNNLINAN